MTVHGLAAVTAGAAAVAVFVPAGDAVELAAIATTGAGAVGLAGAAALHALRARPLAVQAAAVALTAVLAVAGGAWAAARAMFVSAHDLEALGIVLVAAGVVGTAVAVILARRVGGATRALVDLARRIGDGEAGVGAAAGSPATTELAAVARELEHMSRQLDDARARERALESSRRELVAWVSHDLRTPLAAVRAMAEALEDGVVSDPETVARYHRQLTVEVDRLAGLVDDLFELSRTSAGVVELHREPASLGDLISDALAGAAPVAQAKGVRLEGRLDSPTPEVALSTPEVARALRNLLENAIRHTPSDGTVRVEVGVDGGHAFVAVADACGGIPESDLDRVFDVAFRGEAARTSGGGTGLGLAIARGMVEAHGGEITVGNEEAGCRFTVRLPLDDQITQDTR